jgi:hypothetical protein
MVSDMHIVTLASSGSNRNILRDDVDSAETTSLRHSEARSAEKSYLENHELRFLAALGMTGLKGFSAQSTMGI